MQNPIFNAISKKIESETYANILGLKLVKLEYGYSLMEMTYSKDIENMFQTGHGGAIFSLIDEAFGAASNSHGTVAVALNVNVTYVKPALEGDTLYAEAKEISRSNRIGTYDIRVVNDKDELVAVCQAVAYRKKDRLPFLD